MQSFVYNIYVIRDNVEWAQVLKGGMWIGEIMSISYTFEMYDTRELRS